MSKRKVGINSWPSTSHGNLHPHLSPSAAVCCAPLPQLEFVQPFSEMMGVRMDQWCQDTPGHKWGTNPSEYPVRKLSCYLMSVLQGPQVLCILIPLSHPGPWPSKGFHLISSRDASCLGFAPCLVSDSPQISGVWGFTAVLCFLSSVECMETFNSVPSIGPGSVYPC